MTKLTNENIDFTIKTLQDNIKNGHTTVNMGIKQMLALFEELKVLRKDK